MAGLSVSELNAEITVEAAIVKATPFHAFRIVLNSGRAYDIRHPEMLKVGRITMNIFTYAGEPADP